jgi:hypothetical protein
VQHKYPYQTVNEFDVPRALRVTVTCSILGTSRVTLVLAQTTISVHGGEVQGAVQATWEVGDIDVKGEFVANEIEGLIGLIILHKIDTRANICSSNELERKRITSGGDTINPLIVSTVNCAVCSARLGVRAEG